MSAGARVRAPRAGLLLAVLVVLIGFAGPVAPAAALPPDGAGADTPGTSASVSPTTLAPGATLSFTLSGFPAGETVYVKIDDGVGYGDTAVQGSGVVHQQAIPSSGTVSGSFTVPSGITAGAHWLRFLASAELYAADGSYLGVEGYTHRGGADFTVVIASSGDSGTGAAAGSGTTSSGSAPGSGTAAGSVAAGTTSGSGATAVTGQGGVVQAQPTAAPTADATADATAEATPDATAEAGPTTAASATPVVADAPATAPADAGTGAPVAGIVVGGILVLAGAAFVATVLVRRRFAVAPAAPVTTTGGADDPGAPLAPAGR